MRAGAKSLYSCISESSAFGVGAASCTVSMSRNTQTRSLSMMESALPSGDHRISQVWNAVEMTIYSALQQTLVLQSLTLRKGKSLNHPLFHSIGSCKTVLLFPFAIPEVYSRPFTGQTRIVRQRAYGQTFRTLRIPFHLSHRPLEDDCSHKFNRRRKRRFRIRKERVYLYYRWYRLCVVYCLAVSLKLKRLMYVLPLLTARHVPSAFHSI